MNEELRKSYLQLIETVVPSDVLRKYLSDFVSTYDGSNLKELNSLLLMIVHLSIRLDSLIVKAKAYDELSESNSGISDEMSQILSEFEYVRQGKPMPEPPVVSGDVS